MNVRLSVGLAHQRRRLEPAGDLGRVRVVVVGDQELDVVRDPFFSAPRMVRASAFIATSKVAIFTARWVAAPSATTCCWR